MSPHDLEEMEGDDCPSCGKGQLILYSEVCDIDDDGWPIVSHWLECNECGEVADGD